MERSVLFGIINGTFGQFLFLLCGRTVAPKNLITKADNKLSKHFQCETIPIPSWLWGSYNAI